MPIQLNEITLQRLVDGEMDARTRRDLLCSVDESPEGWRTVALAFLEMQTVERISCEIAGPLNELNDGSVERPAAPAALGRAERTVPKRRWSSALRGLTAAVTVVAALFIGSRLGNVWTGPERNPIGSGVVSDASEKNQEGLRSEFLLQVVGQANDVLEIPVFEWSSLGKDDFEWSEPLVTQELSRALEKLGFQANETQDFVTVELEEGRFVAWPVNTLDLRHNVLGYAQ